MALQQTAMRQAFLDSQFRYRRAVHQNERWFPGVNSNPVAIHIGGDRGVDRDPSSPRLLPSLDHVCAILRGGNQELSCRLKIEVQTRNRVEMRIPVTVAGSRSSRP